MCEYLEKIMKELEARGLKREDKRGVR